MPKTTTPPTPGALVNVVVAAHRAGDKPMERSARQILATEYGIRLSLSQTEPKPAIGGEAPK
jgi:hypothetical protein